MSKRRDLWGPLLAGLLLATGCSKDPLAQLAKEPGAQKLDSGVVYRRLKAGTGARPGPTDAVRVHYVGHFPDGTVFDSSRDRGVAYQFSLLGTIPCWAEGLQKMQEGEIAEIGCPPHTAYGEEGKPPRIPRNATLLYEIELLNIGDP